MLKQRQHFFYNASLLEPAATEWFASSDQSTMPRLGQRVEDNALHLSLA
jgi:hypothetical protein